MVPPLHLCLDDLTEDPALDTAVARVILERVDAGELPATLRLSRPPRVVAFSRQDARSPGFARAVAGARATGFDAVLRLAGGRAAVFHEGTIAFAWAVPATDPIDGITARFRTMATALATAFQRLGVDARIGEVPGEYCAGRWSVNVAGRRKLAGVGQRVVRRAAHTGGVVVVDDAAAVIRALTPVYAAFELDWDPAATGALADEAALTWEGTRTAIAEVFAEQHDVRPWRLDAPTLVRARAIADEHRVEG